MRTPALMAAITPLTINAFGPAEIVPWVRTDGRRGNGAEAAGRTPRIQRLAHETQGDAQRGRYGEDEGENVGHDRVPAERQGRKPDTECEAFEQLVEDDGQEEGSCRDRIGPSGVPVRRIRGRKGRRTY